MYTVNPEDFVQIDKPKGLSGLKSRAEVKDTGSKKETTNYHCPP